MRVLRKTRVLRKIKRGKERLKDRYSTSTENMESENPYTRREKRKF